MSGQLEPWGGELRMPWLFRRLLHRPDPPQDTPERRHECRNPAAMTETPLEAIDRAIFGGFSDYHPGNRTPERRG
jgi:hypothetical protein